MSHVSNDVGHLKSHLNKPYLEWTRIVTSENLWLFEIGDFQQVPGASLQVTIPESAGNRHIIATFTTDSKCEGVSTSRCVLQTFIGGVKAEPGASDATFRSGGGPWQSGSIVRSRLVPPGTYTVSVEGGVSDGATPSGSITGRSRSKSRRRSCP